MKKNGRLAFLDRKETPEGFPWKEVFFFIFRKIDLLQILVTLCLFGIGLAFIYGTGQQSGASTTVLWQKQLQYFALGMFFFLILSLLDYRYMGFAAVAAYPIAVGMLVYVLFHGTKYYGATRWISVAGYSVQPSELAKLAVVLTVARMLSLEKVNVNNPLWLLAVLLLTGVPFFLIYKEPDLGTGLVMLAAVGAMIFSAKLKWKYILLLAVLIPVLGAAGYFSMKQYQRDRVKVFLDPEHDTKNRGWSQLQAEIAVGQGGVTGKGFMQGTHNALGYLPQTVSNSDFIFPVIAEEKGLAGAYVLLGLYIILMFTILRTALVVEDDFGRYLCIGSATTLFVHSAVNIGMCIRLAPVTGLPLPLVSYGGTFLIATMCYLGLVHSVYIHSSKKSIFDL
ncbi:MAG: rod shape-determining protein RodA [Lentisphaeria bacterium]|nr:rod shape-determining protein RodA [Lentisphaeria bacterium]